MSTMSENLIPIFSATDLDPHSWHGVRTGQLGLDSQPTEPVFSFTARRMRNFLFDVDFHVHVGSQRIRNNPDPHFTTPSEARTCLTMRLSEAVLAWASLAGQAVATAATPPHPVPSAATTCLIQATDLRVEGLAQRTPTDLVAVGMATPTLSWMVRPPLPCSPSRRPLESPFGLWFPFCFVECLAIV